MKKKKIIKKSLKINRNRTFHDIYSFKSFTGVVIIPLKKDTNPVLIFKDYGAPFYYEGPDKMGEGFLKEEILNDYMVYWKGKFFYHDLPKIIQDEYGNFFHKLVEAPLPTHLMVDEFPKKSVEIPIPLLRSKVKIHEPKYLTYTKKILRELGFLSETRGKKRLNRLIISRDKLIIKFYKELGSPKRFPIAQIRDKLELFYQELGNEKLPENIVPSDTHIRRILKRYLKEKEKKREKANMK